MASGVAGMLGSMFQASMGSNTARGNANAGDVSFSENLNRFKISHMRPKVEYLQCIDEYFTRFGYKVNRLKQPNITGRSYWNYIEIAQQDDFVWGNIPNNDLEQINNIARKGVTIWHNHTNIGNYSLNNAII